MDPISQLKMLLKTLKRSDQDQMLKMIMRIYRDLTANALQNNQVPKSLSQVEVAIIEGLGGSTCYCNQWCTQSCSTPGSCPYATNCGCPCCKTPNCPPGVNCCG